MRSLNIIGINVDLDCLDAIQAQVDSLNKKPCEEFQRCHEAQLIATIPGIGYYGALLIFTEIADIHRFSNPEHLSSYAGLVPSVSQSASTCHYGGVSKEGSAYLRWILTESVHVHRFCCRDSQLSRFAAKIEKKRGKQKATSAAARKLVHIIYWMLVNDQPFDGQGSNPATKPAILNA
jgi:transposase